MRLTVVAALLLTGCMAVQPPGDSAAELARAVEGRVAGETRTCVPLDTTRSLTVIDSRTLLLDRGATLWVNRLGGECPGLDVHGTLIVEPSTGQYCRGDRFRELESGSIIPGPYCTLGDFTAYRHSR